MSKFSLFGKLVAQPGQRDALAAILLESAASMQNLPGCELYIINISPTDPDGIWIFESWTSSEAHVASLTLESVKAAIQRGRPLIAGFEQRVELQPLGGKGLS